MHSRRPGMPAAIAFSRSGSGCCLRATANPRAMLHTAADKGYSRHQSEGCTLLLTSPTCSSCPLLELQQLLLIVQGKDDFALAPRLLQHKAEG